MEVTPLRSQITSSSNTIPVIRTLNGLESDINLRLNRLRESRSLWRYSNVAYLLRIWAKSVWFLITFKAIIQFLTSRSL